MLITQVRNFPLAYHVLKTVKNPRLPCYYFNPNAGEELHDYVEAFCDNMDSSVTLPDIGTWVAVRVTAIFNPGHFWVQFPYGTEPIEKRIMAGMFLVLLSMLWVILSWSILVPYVLDAYAVLWRAGITKSFCYPLLYDIN